MYDRGCLSSYWCLVEMYLPGFFTIVFCLVGYVVVRYYCKQKEQRRQRIFEKALDACATSPFARHVSRWVLAGSDDT